jgi:hypothetical protein
MTPMEQPERPRQEGNVHHLETQLRARVQMMIAWEARREAREIVRRRSMLRNGRPTPRGSITRSARSEAIPSCFARTGQGS